MDCKLCSRTLAPHQPIEDEDDGSFTYIFECQNKTCPITDVTVVSKRRVRL